MSQNRCKENDSSHTHTNSETDMEYLLKSLLGNIDPEEGADLIARNYEKRIARKGITLKAAQNILRHAQRLVGRRDMLTAMEIAIMDRVCAFEEKADLVNSILLFGTVICKNMLMDGPLHEGA